MNKVKFYFLYGLSHTLYELGDFVSKSLNWEWLSKDGEFQEWIVGHIYNVYNWLMMRSLDIDEKGHYGVWTTNTPASDPLQRFGRPDSTE